MQSSLNLKPTRRQPALLERSHSAFPPSWKDACFIMLGSNGTNIWHSLFGLKKSPAGQRESCSQKRSELISAKSCCKYLLFSCVEEKASFWQDSKVDSLVIWHRHHDCVTWRVGKSKKKKVWKSGAPFCQIVCLFLRPPEMTIWVFWL